MRCALATVGGGVAMPQVPPCRLFLVPAEAHTITPTSQARRRTESPEGRERQIWAGHTAARGAGAVPRPKGPRQKEDAWREGPFHTPPSIIPKP